MKIMISMSAILWCSLAMAMPEVSRRICASEYAPGGFYRVELKIVTEGGKMPEALIISEDWPEGFRIVDGFWNGRRFRPVRRGKWCSWLFGYGEGNPPFEPGCLNYVVSAPDNGVRQLSAVYGKVSVAGEENDILGDESLSFEPEAAAPQAEQLDIPRGWSLHVMAFDAGTAASELAGDGPCFTLGPGNAWVQWRSEELPAGRAFWIWRGVSDSMVLTEKFPQLEVPHSTAMPAGHKWQIMKNTLLDGEADVDYWENGSYRRGRAEDTRGQAVWAPDN